MRQVVRWRLQLQNVGKTTYTLEGKRTNRSDDCKMRSGRTYKLLTDREIEMLDRSCNYYGTRTYSLVVEGKGAISDCRYDYKMKAGTTYQLKVESDDTFRLWLRLQRMTYSLNLRDDIRRVSTKQGREYVQPGSERETSRITTNTKRGQRRRTNWVDGGADVSDLSFTMEGGQGQRTAWRGTMSDFYNVRKGRLTS